MNYYDLMIIIAHKLYEAHNPDGLCNCEPCKLFKAVEKDTNSNPYDKLKEVSDELYEACLIGLSYVLSEEGTDKEDSTTICKARDAYKALTASDSPVTATEAPEASKPYPWTPKGRKRLSQEEIETAGLYATMEDCIEDLHRLAGLMRERGKHE